MYMAIKLRKNSKKNLLKAKTLKALSIYSFYRFKMDYRCVLFYCVFSKNRQSSLENLLDILIDNSSKFSENKMD